jgi:hypothetical protein
MRRCWLTFAAAALVTGAYAAQVAVPAAETSPAPISGIAPSYGPKTVSAVHNAAAIVRRIWLPGLDAGYDPQGLAVAVRMAGNLAFLVGGEPKFEIHVPPAESLQPPQPFPCRASA